jgi:hypothetical protein
MENQGFLPPVFTVDDYRARTEGLGIKGGTVVAGSFQGTRTAYRYARKAVRDNAASFYRLRETPLT